VAKAMKIVAIVQARMGSVRLPGKVMKPICDMPMIELLLRRLKSSKRLHQIIVAISESPENHILVDHVQRVGFEVLRGSEQDVLSRYALAARVHQADIIVRITGDCPLVDAELVDAMIAAYEGFDYLSNIDPPTFPDGLDVEVFSRDALDIANREAVDAYDREHVTPFLRRSLRFKKRNWENLKDLSNYRWTVDELADFKLVSRIFEHFFPRIDFSWQEILEFEINRSVGTGQKLWKRAQKLIPGGNMLLSKKAEMFLPGKWPSYFSKAKGCRVWDLDGREYIDMSLMGVGTNALGYGHPEVDDAVRSVIDTGNMTTLNCPEEVQLAERLIELHPWAQMVKLARSGGEANAIAIRIARAASGKDKVAICGYHGWHDWYLSANLQGSEHLAGHLLPGLEPLGVPKSLAGMTLPFEYNDFNGLKQLVDAEPVGVIKMEVMRNHEPKNDFLQRVRKLASEKGIVLVFDECTSAFRQTFGGLHKQYGVEPDLAVFGKTLGNGYAITSVIGRREVMEVAQDTFMSSTFWTERIGPAAALKALEVMERERSWVKITEIGQRVCDGWKRLADEHSIEIQVSGLPALASFIFKSPQALAYKTLITQEMLKAGYLASSAFYASMAHAPDVIEGYFQVLREVFQKISACEAGTPIEKYLEYSVCQAGFRRLN
jgi:glutamate-1-semialdehyde 2,1-aminomutase